MKSGDIAKFVGLSSSAHLNGRYVEIATDLVEIEVAIPGGYRKAMQYGVVMLGAESGGYALPENLELVASGDDSAMCRACWIHATGTEGPYG